MHAQAPEVKTFIDDRVDWMPRVSGYPESAPAYDQVRKVNVHPMVLGGVCSKTHGCVCFTQQGTDAGIGSDECRKLVDKPRFNPYLVQAKDDKKGASAPSSAAQKPQEFETVPVGDNDPILITQR